MIISVHNRQRLRRVDPSALARLARFLMGCALPARRGDGGWAALGIALVDDEGIAACNRTYLDHPRATDVIAFTLPPAPGRRGPSGDLLVNLERALARTRGPAAAARELALYLAHGCDHLAGGRDNTPAARRRMLRRNARWVRLAVARGLVPALDRRPARR